MLTNVGDGKFKIGSLSHFNGKNIFKKKKGNRKEKNKLDKSENKLS